MEENTYFNVKLEFDHDKVDQIIHDTIINNEKTKSTPIPIAK